MFPNAKSFCFNAPVKLCFYFITCFITNIIADCTINLPEDTRVRPNLYRQVGTYRFEIDTDGKPALKLDENQKVEADCDLYFNSNIEDIKSSNKIFIKCESSYIYMATDADFQRNSHYVYSASTLECNVPQLDLYESENNFEWCPSNVTSYNLAAKNFWDPEKSPYVFLAGICYNIYTNSFNSIYYTLGPYKTKNVQPHIFENSLHPGLWIEYIKQTFGYNSISETQFENYNFKSWITDLKYDFSSVIQHPELSKKFNDKFTTLLEFMWWPNLRSNNWQRYIQALDQHVENDNKTYEILAGVSGAIKVTTVRPCQKKYFLQEVVFNKNRKIPQYIWNYLQDRSNNSNQMVIIGFNSPIDELNSQDVIFCPDICQEISWLKEASSSFRFNLMGTIFCCNVQDIRLSKRLDGFPENDFFSGPIITTELPEESHEEITEGNYNLDND